MNNKPKLISTTARKMRQPALLLVLCAVFMVLARFSGIMYSFFVTDALYRESVICDVLQSLRMILSAVSVAFGASAAVWNILNRKKATFPVLITGAVLLADGAAVILYDLIEGALKRRVLIGIIYRSMSFAYSFILLLVGLLVASLILKNKKPKILAVAAAAAFAPVLELAYALWNYVSNLIEWEFMPTDSEISTMLYEGGTLLLCAVFSAAVGVVVFKKYKGREKPEKEQKKPSDKMKKIAKKPADSSKSAEKQSED